MTKSTTFKIREDFIKKLLYDIVKDFNISSQLIFKWWTSLMLFYGLNRFSEDLDFNYFDLDLKKIEKLLKDHDYTFVKESTEFWERFIVSYKENNCILDFSKYNYKTKPEFEVKTINWAPVRVFKLSQNFAHKLCAFYERKKGRDVYDVNFYLEKKVIPNKNILQERHSKDFSFFMKELIVEMNKPYLEARIENALRNFDYENLNLDDFKTNLISTLSKNYLDWKFNFNIEYKKQLQNNQNLISLTKDFTLIYKWQVFNPKIRWDYAVLNSQWKILYEANTVDKLNTYVYSSIIWSWLSELDKYEKKSFFSFWIM